MKVCTLLSQRASFIGYALAHGGKSFPPLFAPCENVLRDGSRRKNAMAKLGKHTFFPMSLPFSQNPKTQNAKNMKRQFSKFEMLLVFCSCFAICRRRRQTRCAHECVSRVKALPRLALAYMYLGLDPCHYGRRVCNKVLGERGCPTPSYEKYAHY
jgi:hypothetical protein